MDRHKMYPSLAQLSLRYMVLSQLYGWSHDDIAYATHNFSGAIPARTMYHCISWARVKGWVK